MYMFDLNAGLSVNSTEQKTLRVLMSLFFGRYMYASNVKKTQIVLLIKLSRKI